MNCGAIILCGGHSKRMGYPKALLPFGPELMLQRMVRLVSEAVPTENVAVVRSARQQIPPLAKSVIVTEDKHKGKGPLAGIAAGLKVLTGRAEAVYVTGCDAPRLESEFVKFTLAMLGDFEAVVPHDDQRIYPLAAVYRVEILDIVENRLARNQLRMQDLVEALHAPLVSTEQLRQVDSELASLDNLNTPADYLAALRALDVEPAANILAKLTRF